MDGGPIFQPRDPTGYTFLVAALLEGSRILDVKIGTIRIDGLDSQRVLLALLKGLSYDAIMLSGVAFGGFNVIDIMKVARKVRKPVIVIIRDPPDNKAVRNALRKHFRDWRQRWERVRHAGPMHSCKPMVDEPSLCYEVRGASPAFARRIIIASCTVARLPEPVRVAGIIAKGLRGGLVGLHEVNEANL